ncbi:MAG: 50S ribosomal protein L10 [bacterium]
MAINKQKKVDIIAKLKDKALKANTIVFVNFHGVPVATITEMRNKLRAEGVGYMVAKKTLIRRAFADTKYTGELPELGGEIAVAYGDDQIAPARGVYEYQKKNPDMVKIVGGVFEDRYMDAGAMMSIATIPSREVLLGQFVNVINSPIQGLVMALDAIAKKNEVTA